MPNFQQKILLCAPDFYGVEYVINPWMENNTGKTDHEKVMRQWTGLKEKLAKYCDLAFVDPVKGLPDMVFTANAGFVLGELVVVSRFRSKERSGEEGPFKRWFEAHGFKAAPWPSSVFFEGAGDALLDRERDILWCGYGFRSDEAASQLLAHLYPKRRVKGLKLVDPRFYHLDTCFCPLSRGFVMYYPPALSDDSQAKIEQEVPVDKRIIVSEADALTFACNAVDLDPYIVLNESSDALTQKLADKGFRTETTPLTEFLKAGGTAKCLTLKLNEA